MTLDVKNLYSFVHHKDKLFTVLDYPRKFGNVAKEGLMRTTHWTVYYFTNPNSWYPVPERARILPAVPAVQPLPTVPMAPQEDTKDEGMGVNICCSSASAFCQTGNNDGKSWKFGRSNRSASNALTSRSSKKTAGNKTKRKMDYWSTIPRVMMMTLHLWNERLIYTSEEVPASDKVFASAAELCSVNFYLSPLLWNHGIVVIFCDLCTY